MIRGSSTIEEQIIVSNMIYINRDTPHLIVRFEPKNLQSVVQNCNFISLMTPLNMYTKGKKLEETQKYSEKATEKQEKTSIIV